MKSGIFRVTALVITSTFGLQMTALAQEGVNRTPADLPDAPSIVAQNNPPAAPASASTPDNSSAEPDQSLSQPQQPHGAAAAEVQPTTGTSASQPAGAAIAPAKQKRSRSWLIRIGAIAGVGAALGTAFALSSASPSKPPGAN